MSNTLAKQKKSNVSARERPVRNAKLNHTLSTFQNLREPKNIMYIDTILEEIKSYLASALHLFELLPSSSQSYKPQSNNTHSLSAEVSQCTTPLLPCLPIKSPTLVEAQAAENTPRKQYLAFSQASQLIPAISPKCESEDSVHNRQQRQAPLIFSQTFWRFSKWCKAILVFWSLQVH